MEAILEISQAIKQLKSDKEIYSFLQEILTQAELIDLSKRWRILKMLNEGCTQREIAKSLNVSLCKITRGSQIINNKNAISTKYL
jgi:TrpR family trp operon transcriptional repressor